MTIDATFWVAISFVLFIGLLIYFKIPQKVNETLNQLISNIKNEIDESEKLRNEAKILLDNSQSKLDSANEETSKIVPIGCILLLGNGRGRAKHGITSGIYLR